MNEDLLNKFGFSEMYEWSDIPLQEFKLGRFVQFDPKDPMKVKLCENTKNIVGVTTVNSAFTSDNEDRWHLENLANEYGDTYIRKEDLAVGNKVYDQYEEFSYIATRPWSHYIPIKNPQFDENKKFVKRTERGEWVRVNLIGKVIVKDNGKCKPGEYCTLYEGKLKELQGTVIPATAKSKIKFYVNARVSESTILILNK